MLKKPLIPLAIAIVFVVAVALSYMLTQSGLKESDPIRPLGHSRAFLFVSNFGGGESSAAVEGSKTDGSAKHDSVESPAASDYVADGKGTSLKVTQEPPSDVATKPEGTKTQSQDPKVDQPHWAYGEKRTTNPPPQPKKANDSNNATFSELAKIDAPISTERSFQVQSREELIEFKGSGSVEIGMADETYGATGSQRPESESRATFSGVVLVNDAGENVPLEGVSISQNRRILARSDHPGRFSISLDIAALTGSGPRDGGRITMPSVSLVFEAPGFELEETSVGSTSGTCNLFLQKKDLKQNSDNEFQDARLLFSKQDKVLHRIRVLDESRNPVANATVNLGYGYSIVGINSLQVSMLRLITDESGSVEFSLASGLHWQATAGGSGWLCADALDGYSNADPSFAASVSSFDMIVKRVETRKFVVTCTDASSLKGVNGVGVYTTVAVGSRGMFSQQGLNTMTDENGICEIWVAEDSIVQLILADASAIATIDVGKVGELEHPRYQATITQPSELLTEVKLRLRPLVKAEFDQSLLTQLADLAKLDPKASPASGVWNYYVKEDNHCIIPYGSSRVSLILTSTGDSSGDHRASRLYSVDSYSWQGEPPYRLILTPVE